MTQLKCMGAWGASWVIHNKIIFKNHDNMVIIIRKRSNPFKYEKLRINKRIKDNGKKDFLVTKN